MNTEINKNEVWKTVSGFSNYMVSNRGRIKNKTSGLILHPSIDKEIGYFKVNLWRDAKGYSKNVHRLVAEAFIPNPENKRVVNHKDCNKTNNCVDNLEWATDSENMKHAFNNGLCENTRKAAYIQQYILSKKPITQKQIETARKNMIAGNKRPKTEKQLEASRKNISSPICKLRASESKFDKHPPIKVVETGEVYRSQRELAEKYGLNESSVCACLHNRKTHSGGYHFEYVGKEEYEKSKKQPFLRDYQIEAVNKMRNGCILCGGVGSGKSRTSLYYYFSKNGGSIDPDYSPMKPNPPDLYIITTAQKRDTLEWQGELIPFLLSTDPKQNQFYGNRVVVDSWNNVQKYSDITGAQFIFDEDRVTGSGAWVKAFLKIAKNNEWVILSATPGDKYEDYIPVFVANGFYKNKTEFSREHLIYSRFAKFPKVDGYRNTVRLDRLRERVLIDMDFDRPTTSHHEDIYTDYDIPKYKNAMRNRWDPYKNEPITQASGLCYVLRRIVNEDESRQVALLELYEKHPRIIIFYSFDYERDILLNLSYGEDVEIAEWSGHAHQPVPDGKKWVYLVNYSAGNSGWNCIKTDTIVFFSQNYSYKVMVQAAGRIDRLNTPFTDLYYYHLKSRSGIDLAISKALKNKKKFNERKFTKWD